MASPLSRRVYDHLPRMLQNGALNLYGLKNQRRLKQWNRILASLADSERWSPEEQRRYVADRLRDLLQHAVRFVPRYAGLAPLAPGLEDPRADVFEALTHFPPVTRQEILAEPGAFVSTAFDRSTLKKTITSGTTGSPFSTWIEPDVLLTSDALWWRRTLWAGWKPGDWIARLVGDPVIPLTNRDPSPPYRVSIVDRRLYFSTYHLSERTARRIAEILLERRPAFFMGYPSALDALARLCEGVIDLREWKPKAVLFSSEPMYEHQREAIARVIHAPLRGLYGCAERIISAAQCAEGSYHMSLVDGFVEGQFGEAPFVQPTRITGLLNRAMPLIRYELGDSVATLEDKACRCGRTLPLINPVVTKFEDSLLTPSGRVISPSILTWAFKDVKGVRKSQIVQREDLSVEVLVQCAEVDFAHAKATLRPRLKELVFDEVPIRFCRVDELELTTAGKTRFVVNESGRDVGRSLLRNRSGGSDAPTPPRD